MPSKINIMKEQGKSVTPATLSTIRPGTPVVPLKPDEADALNEVARQQGMATAEAMKKIAERLPQQQQPKPTITDQSLNKIQQARELSLAGDDLSDPLNQMMRYGFFKDLRKDLKKTDDERLSPRERMDILLEVGMMRALLPQQDGTPQNQQVQNMISELKSENEKQRLFYEQKLKDQEDKIREIVLEKRFQTMEQTQVETVNSLKQQLDDVSKRLELYQNIPTNVTPEEKKDVISHLESLGKETTRIRNALSEIGIFTPPQAGAGAGVHHETDLYKKSDGTVDYFRYSIDKLENTVGKITDAWQKKTPERKQIEATPPPEGTKQERRLSPEEYADYLLSKQTLDQTEAQWLNDYNEYLAQEQAKLKSTRVQYKPQQERIVQQPQQPVQQEVELNRCRLCGRPEIYLDGFCELCFNEQNKTPEQAQVQQKKSVLERLQEQEEDEIRRTQGLL